MSSLVTMLNLRHDENARFHGMRTFRPAVLLVCAIGAAGCGKEGGTPSGGPVTAAGSAGAADLTFAADIRERLSQLPRTPIDFDRSLLDAKETQAVGKLMEGARFMHDIFLVQVSAENPELRDRLGLAEQQIPAAGWALALFDVHYRDKYGFNVWQAKDSAKGMPLIHHNPKSTSDHGCRGCKFASKALTMHPGPHGERAVLRWKAREAGQFMVAVEFYSETSGVQPTTDVSVMADAKGCIQVTPDEKSADSELLWASG